MRQDRVPRIYKMLWYIGISSTSAPHRMNFLADIHLHSRWSRATSCDLTPENLHMWSMSKGISVVGSADFTHPEWLAELKEKLVPAEDGLYRLHRVQYLTSDPDGPVDEARQQCRAVARFARRNLLPLTKPQRGAPVAPPVLQRRWSTGSSGFTASSRGWSAWSGPTSPRGAPTIKRRRSEPAPSSPPWVPFDQPPSR